ncbi:ATP-grasp domain-containing protein [Streptomyces avicenniae]|uniref:ATP-grasp domain-containing protein n=1 Tax=Streptomyces avicenniae TaxID=500153 RepID=UPI0006993AD8|nr:hypothetical protein [Streptomyces avicenniae]
MAPLCLATDETSLPIDHDMTLLLEACREAGLKTEVCAWDDPDIDWSRFGAVVLRSPWTYVEQLPEFLAWCERVDAATRLLNPLPVVRWSLDKHYLADLAAHGVPVVPTTFLGRDADPSRTLREFQAAHPEAAEVVVKPTVGAYSLGVRRFPRARHAEAADYAAGLLAKGSEVMVQPYLDAIDLEGETDLIYFDGTYSHAIRKSAMLAADGTVNVPLMEFRQARDADEGERAVASAVLDAAAAHLRLDQPLLYGRIDLVRGSGGEPLVLEAELCEPSLSLPFAEAGATRFAEAMAARLARPR